jgi:hypothetical protein
MPKRSRKDEVDELLEEADASTDSVKMTPKEASVIAKYCKLSIKCKQIEGDAKSKLKDAKASIKKLRESLLKALKADECELLVLPPDLRKQADARAEAAGIPKLPPYVRVLKNAKDLTITTEVLEDAFSAVTEDDIMESDLEGTDALIEVVLAGVRRIIRSFNEQVKLTESLPRGVRAADIEFADSKLAQHAIQLYEQSEHVLKVEREKREAVMSTKLELEAQKPDIETFFARAKRVSQGVTLNGATYKLFCRTTVTKPKVTITVLQNLLQDGVRECLLKSSKKPTKAEIAASLAAKRKELLRTVLARFGTLASTSKTSIHLQSSKHAS